VEKRSLRRPKLSTKGGLAARRRRRRRRRRKRGGVGKCIDVDGGIFGHLF
jgi:hypothetical protein